MFKRRCPYCRERIRRDAVVCRFCGRELTPEAGAPLLPAPILFTAGGILAGVLAALGIGLYRERMRWEEARSVEWDDVEGE